MGRRRTRINRLKSLISYGNHKLPKSTAIYNMSPALDCEADRLGLCEHSEKCYAKKAERFRPKVLPYRRRQKRYWIKATAEDFIEDFRKAIKVKQHKITALRFGEAGDFITQECVDKAETIATALKKDKIVTYCYTARSDLDFSECENLVVNTSSFLKATKYGTTNVYFPIKEFSGKHFKCPADCRVCNYCTKKHGKIIEAKFH